MIRMSSAGVRRAAVAAILSMVAVRAYAQKTTTAGEFTVEPPTLLSLGFDWKIAGDDNRNASVDVSYACAAAIFATASSIRQRRMRLIGSPPGSGP